MRLVFTLLLLSMMTAGVVMGQPAPAPASPTVDQMRQMLDASARRGTLVMDGAEPVHLVATFEELDPKGKVTSKGTLDELWAGPTRYRQTVTEPAMKQVSDAHGSRFVEDDKAPPAVLIEADDGVQLWRTGQWVVPQAQGVAIEAVLNPYGILSPTTKRLSFAGDFQKNNALECIGTEPDLAGVGEDVRLTLTTYCMEKGNHIARVLVQSNARDVVLNDIEPFGGKFIARTVSVMIGGIVREKLHVDVLEPAKDFHELNEPAPGGAQLLRFHRADSSHPYPLVTSGEVMVGQLLSGGGAQSLHSVVGDSHGTVVLNIHVDTTGAVTAADVLKTSSPLFVAPVVAAVKQWRFRVSYRADRIVPVVHPLTVNF